MDLRRDAWGTERRLTFGEGDELPQAWSPSSDRVFFARNLPPVQARTIVAQAADGTGAVAEIVASKVASAADVSRDGKFLVYADSGNEPAKTGTDLWYAALDGDKKTPRLFVEAPTTQTDPRVSPEGRFLAYVSSESGRTEVCM